MPEVTLITPTSDRPVAFALCERWMQRAINHYGQPVEWIVVDDGTTPVRCTLGQKHLRRPKSAERANSFLGNLALGLRSATSPCLLFIEDDDWYAPNYLSVMIQRLAEADIVGEAEARYYNLQSRSYKTMGNTSHASLCQTGVRRNLAAWMLEHIERHKRIFIDIHTWKTGAATSRRRLEPNSRLSVGMKGLPGTLGLGHGHRMTQGTRADPTGAKLAEWTTADDARVYQHLLDQQRITTRQNEKASVLQR